LASSGVRGLLILGFCGATWNADPSFSVADALLADPEFASVLKVVLRDGHVMVPAIKTEK
jgi:hypothetical protein